MKKQKILTALCAWVASVLFVQAQPFSAVLPEDSIISRIWKQNLLFPREKLYTMTDKAAYIPGDTIWLRSFVTDAAEMKGNCISRYVYAELISPADTLIKRIRIAKDENGVFGGYLPIPYQAPPGKHLLRCYTQYSRNWEEKGIFSRPIHILTLQKEEVAENRPKNDSFHVGFYPEGGTLVAGQLCRVAFKAETKDGNAIGMHGWITDGAKDTICRFQAIHQGMGDFSFIPKPGVQYVAECHSGKGDKKSFKLPQAEENACALKIEKRKGVIYLSAVKGKGFPEGTMQLLAVSRERPVYASLWKPETHISFPDTLFKDGILHFYLLKDGLIVSKRSVFIASPQRKTSISLSKKPESPFRQYEKVNLEFSLTGKDGKPLNGTAALAVTDRSDLLPDSLQTIVSELLLSSDLRGTIQDPAWYFRNNEPEQENYALDVLMRIHAWCRYDMPAVLEADYQTPDILPEASMAISGKVTTRIRRKPVAEATVNMHIKDSQGVRSTRTDENGLFRFDGFEYPDSTSFLISTARQNGKIDVVLNVDQADYPSMKKAHLQHAAMQTAQDNLISVNYADKAVKNISANGDVRNYLLGDITITATKPRTFLTRFEIVADKVIKEEEIEKSPMQDLSSFIYSRTGVNFFTFRGPLKSNTSETKATNRVLVLDDVPVSDMETIRWILTGGMRKEDIQQIEVLKGLKCVGYFGSKCDLIISISTKRGGSGKGADYTDTNFAYLTPLGAQEPKEFYTPHYETKKPRQPDLRTTIHWMPDVLFENGKAAVSFYTAATASAYTVLLEGIADNEEPFSLDETIFN